jgi:hypothetical protein
MASRTCQAPSRPRPPPVRVVELCGAPGDIVLMRAEVLHASSAHALPAARIVLAPFVYATNARSD